MTAAAWVMSDPKRWARALRGGRLGRMLGRKRGVIGDVPLPVAKQWTAAQPRGGRHSVTGGPPSTGESDECS